MTYRELRQRVGSAVMRTGWSRRKWMSLQTLAGREPFSALVGDRSWSEDGEDEDLVRLAQDCLPHGFYVDVGANLPTKRSNTFRLYGLGMRGLCIEPNLELAALFERVRPRDEVVCAAVGREPGVTVLQRFNYHVYSTCSEDEGERRLAKAGPRMRTELLRRSPVPMLPLSALLARVRDRFDGPFFLLKTDTEGLDLEVLQSNDWERDRPRHVLAESIGQAGEVREFLRGMGYRPAKRFRSNELFSDERLDAGP